MYVPPRFVISRDDAWAAAREAGAGFLISHSEGGFKSVFTPFHFDAANDTIMAHIAKANDWWQSVSDGDEVLVVFNVASTYISPTNYPSRETSPGVVPTWNYVSVEVRGRVTVHHEEEWLRSQAAAVTNQYEASNGTNWEVSDSDPEYIERQLRAIVGLHIAVTDIQGSAKLSQNRPDDHAQVKENLSHGSLREQNVAQRMQL